MMDKELYESIKTCLILHWNSGKTSDEVFKIAVEEHPHVYKGFIWCMFQTLRAHTIGFRY